MQDVRILAALVPLALYLAFLALLNLRRRATVLAGIVDIFALGMGVSGMILVGPIELLQPRWAVNLLGWYVWVLSGGVYLLLLCLAMLMSRPRLVVYNISLDELRQVLTDTIDRVDSRHRWAGSSLSLPTIGVQLHLEENPLMRNVALVANGDQQSQAGWRVLQLELASRLATARTSANMAGAAFALAAAALSGIIAWHASIDAERIAATIRGLWN